MSLLRNASEYLMNPWDVRLDPAVQVVSARVSVIVHATEDSEKVVSALNKAHGQEVSQPVIEKRVLKGHFGNEIATLTVNLRGRLVELSLSNLWRNLSSLDRMRLLEELDNRFDEENRLHVRLDKQECFRGTLRLKDQDPIKAQFSFQGLSDPKREVRQLLESYLK